MLYLARKIDNFLENWHSNVDRMPLIVKGARQIGKTASILKFAKKHYENVIYINFLEEPKYKLINENGKVESVENMGKKRLAYEIKKFKEGTYMLFNFEAKPDSITELERVYRITDDVIKFIVVRK